MCIFWQNDHKKVMQVAPINSTMNLGAGVGLRPVFRPFGPSGDDHGRFGLDIPDTDNEE